MDSIINKIIGYPLGHTQSPLLHNTVYDLLNCNAVMSAYSNQNLSLTLDTLKKLSVGLIAVTMPFKKEILSYLDNKSSEVEELKAANTVIYRDGLLYGYNTDVDGIAYALRDIALANKTVLILGAGGAAHAAAYYLKKNNANLVWLNRTPEHLRSGIALFGGIQIEIQDIDKFAIDMIINATPVGMFPNNYHSPLPDYLFKSNQIMFDMVYNPVETRLIKQAKSQGAICISGLDMFIGQGLKQIELWLNQKINLSDIIPLVKKRLITRKI